MCQLCNVSVTATSKLIGMNIATVSQIFDNADAARQHYVIMEQKDIQLGNRKDWAQVEGDEAVFKKSQVEVDDDGEQAHPSPSNHETKKKKRTSLPRRSTMRH